MIISLGDTLALELARTSNCCGNEQWRGRLCSTHQAWADGYDQAIDDFDLYERATDELLALEGDHERPENQSTPTRE